MTAELSPSTANATSDPNVSDNLSEQPHDAFTPSEGASERFHSTTQLPLADEQIVPSQPVEPSLSSEKIVAAPASSAEPTVVPSALQTSVLTQSSPDLVARGPMSRKASEALGPAVEGPVTNPTTSPASTGLTLYISLLLITGARHPYKIDERYLRSRKVNALTKGGVFDPRELSGYQLKELIWTDWRSEWEPRPVSPSSIRLILMGRMIEDKSTLKDFPFNLQNTNVVHMTIKPADFIDDEDGATKGGVSKNSVLRSRDSDDAGAGAGCRCVIL